MSFSARMQSNHLYTVLLAPRGAVRMADCGMQIAQMYLSPFDLLIGIIGDAGSGKSMLVKGMFPGLELTNDDEGVNVRPLPLLDLDDTGFFKPHTYHMDVRFELGFHQMFDLVEGIKKALQMGRRVIVEHFDLIYPYLKVNADLMIGVGDEILITRPSVFGPEPQEIVDIVFPSIKYRKMAHTAEDLCEICLKNIGIEDFQHADVRQGFILEFDEPNLFDLDELENEVTDLIEQDLGVSYHDAFHVNIGDTIHYCTGPRMHVKSTGQIQDFHVVKKMIKTPVTGKYQMVGLVGKETAAAQLSDLNRLL